MRERSRFRSTGSSQTLRTGPLIVWYQAPLPVEQHIRIGAYHRSRQGVQELPGSLPVLVVAREAMIHPVSPIPRSDARSGLHPSSAASLIEYVPYLRHRQSPNALPPLSTRMCPRQVPPWVPSRSRPLARGCRTRSRTMRTVRYSSKETRALLIRARGAGPTRLARRRKYAHDPPRKAARLPSPPPPLDLHTVGSRHTSPLCTPAGPHPQVTISRPPARSSDRGVLSHVG